MDWIDDNLDVAGRIASRGVCDHCLGRLFGKLGTGMSNEERGDMLREALDSTGCKAQKADICPICDDVFDLMNRFSDAVAEKVLEVDSENFLVGTRVDPESIAKEKAICEEFNLEFAESIKTELNREIGKLALPKINRRVEFLNPQVVACIDTRFADVTLDISPIFISGRYTKYSREIPQTIWPCRQCRGKGCDRCNGTGKMYQTSVQEIIGDIALRMADGESHFFHGMGREDIDAAMLGDGRPFILEISKPRRRFIDLDELERLSNASDMAGYNNLSFATRDMVAMYKAADPDKTYRALVRSDGKVNKDKVDAVCLAFKDVELNQRTPQRVEHRRADLVRKRTVHWVEAEMVDDNSFHLTLRAESGTYVKEFVSGDEGRTNPSFSEQVGTQCVVETLDVLSIDYQLGGN